MTQIPSIILSMSLKNGFIIQKSTADRLVFFPMAGWKVRGRRYTLL